MANYTKKKDGRPINLPKEYLGRLGRDPVEQKRIATLGTTAAAASAKKHREKKEKMYMDNPKNPKETFEDYITRLFEAGVIDAKTAGPLASKMLDKERGNAPVVTVTIDPSDNMSKEEMNGILKKAGLKPEDK